MPLTLPLVGTFFRPGGKAVLEIMPGGAELTLVPEPTNPYDPNAIAAFLRPSDSPKLDTIMDQLEGFGLEPEAMNEPFHIGYVPKASTDMVRALEPTGELELDGEPTGKHFWRATLGFGPDGKPTMTLAS